MIASLRRRHRRLWVAFALILPAIAVLAWRVRRAPAVMDRIPVELREEDRR